MRHILKAEQFESEELARLFSLATRIKDAPYRWTNTLSGRLLGSLFFEPSTRTRWSTEAAMLRLGGQVLSMENALTNSSGSKGETLEDTFKNCSQLVDVLAVRHPHDHSVAKAAACSDVPVINCGDGGNEHPTQSLLDYYTILEKFPDLEGKKLLFTGDLAYSRTIRSLQKLLERTPLKITWARPLPSVVYRGHGDDVGLNCIWEKDIKNEIENYDIIYMTRNQIERWSGGGVVEKSTFCMTPELAGLMKPSAIIMHPGPRTSELPPSVDKNPRAWYFKQAKNGMYVRMALLADLLEEFDH